MLSSSSQDIVLWDATPSQVPRKWVASQEVERGVPQCISSSPEFLIFPPRVHAKHMHAMRTHQISTPWRWLRAFPYVFESSTCQVDPEGLTCWLECLSTHAIQPGTGHSRFTGSEEYPVSQGATTSSLACSYGMNMSGFCLRALPTDLA